MALAHKKCYSSSTTSNSQFAWGQRRTRLHMRSCKANGLLGAEKTTGTPWYEKQKELWQELKSEDELQSAVASLPDGKLLVTDFYAGWCAVCKSAYPALCRVAGNKQFQEHFVFAKGNLDNEGVKNWVKQEGIKGIPYLTVYTKNGVMVMGMAASFRKTEAIKHNLKAIAQHKQLVLERQEPLPLDPNSFVMIPGVPVAASVRS
eukprot:GHRR01006643.1.p1 GENE.GHRR01006643.1~~GHRR01006643.1.p1  ORF type:complete len:204 (+),score=36.72 GHRR01006643.1:272-883(+)